MINFDFMNDIDNYQDRKAAKDELECGLAVSTAFTSDFGYETAILDKKRAIPVERYKRKSLAYKGHKKWIALAKTKPKVVTELEFYNLDKRIVELCY